MVTIYLDLEESKAVLKLLDQDLLQRSGIAENLKCEFFVLLVYFDGDIKTNAVAVLASGSQTIMTKDVNLLIRSKSL